MPAKKDVSKFTAQSGDDSLSLERLVFFSDAVFAIAITLLILEIRLPAAQGELTNEALQAQLIQIWPKYLAYVVSFLVIGMFWLGHMRKFRYIRRTDRPFLLLNLLLLMSVAFIPFPTAVISEFGNRTATIFYAVTIFVAGMLNTGVLIYATQGGRLATQDLPPGFVRREMLRSLITPGIFLLSIPLAFIDADLAKYSWILIFFALVVAP